MYIKRFVKHYYIMLIPALLWLFFFSIVPMFGIVMAFQDYNPGQGILHSKFVGLANFEYMFQMSDITQVLRNTVGHCRWQDYRKYYYPAGLCFAVK